MPVYLLHLMRQLLDAIKGSPLQDQSGKAQTLEVHIPAGIDSGKSIGLRGKGMPGTGKGGADLLLKVNCSAESRL